MKNTTNFFISFIYLIHYKFVGRTKRDPIIRFLMRYANALHPAALSRVMSEKYSKINKILLCLSKLKKAVPFIGYDNYETYLLLYYFLNLFVKSIRNITFSEMFLT